LGKKAVYTIATEIRPVYVNLGVQNKQKVCREYVEEIKCKMQKNSYECRKETVSRMLKQ